MVSFTKDGYFDSATQMTPRESTAKPFGRPVFLTVFLVWPSALMCETQPRSAPPSTINHVPSGRATGPSGALKPVAKIIAEFPSPGRSDFGCLAAVHVHRGARHERSLIRRQKKHGLRQLFGAAQTADRMRRRERIQRLRRESLSNHRRVCRTRNQGIHADTLLGMVDGHGAR